MNTQAIATLYDGRQIAGRLTTEHAASSYGKPVFVDEENLAIDWISIADVTTTESGKVAAALGAIKSEKKAEASRANASKPPRPGSKPRGRPKKPDTE